MIEVAAEALGYKSTDLEAFNTIDPYNVENRIKGFMSKVNGSLYITHVNNEIIDPQCVYTTPKMIPYDKDKLPDATYYYIANKWDGTNILFYRYYNANGEPFITAKTKSTVVINCAAYEAVRDLIGYVLKLKPAQILSKDLPVDLYDFANADVQSVSFELYGNKITHSKVKYDVEIALQPLYKTYDDGSMEPITVGNFQAKPYHYNSYDYVARMCSFRADECAKTNKDGLKIEGSILYLLNEDNKCISRVLYKVPPCELKYEEN